MQRFQISESEAGQIRSLVAAFASGFESVEDDAALKEATVAAHELPRRLRSFLSEFRLLEPDPACCIVAGYPVDQAKIGRTPEHWKTKPRPCTAREEEIFLVLLGS